MPFSLQILRNLDPSYPTLIIPLSLAAFGFIHNAYSQAQSEMAVPEEPLKTASYVGYTAPSPLKDTDFQMRFAAFATLKEPLPTTQRISADPAVLLTENFQMRMEGVPNSVFFKNVPDQIENASEDTRQKEIPTGKAKRHVLLHLEKMMEISFPREV